jgi:hypothetical protein
MGLRAVAASALLTLPFQAGVAICFIARHLDIGLRDVFRATFKSVLVTLCSAGAAAVCAAMVEFGQLGPVWGLALGCISASTAWLLVAAVTEHPLLARLQLTASALYRFLNSPAGASRDSFG